MTNNNFASAPIVQKLQKCSENLIRLVTARTRGRALWSAVDAASAPAASLAIAAGLVRTLGAAEYGVLIIALAVSGLSTAIIPAISATTTKFVSAVSSQRGDDRAASRIISGSLITVVFIDALLLAATFAFKDPLSNLVFGVRVAASVPGIGAVLALAVTSICLQQIDGVLAASLRGVERFGRQAIVEILSRLMLITAALTTAWLTKSVKYVLVAYCCASLVSSAGRAVVVARSLKAGRLFSLPKRADFAQLFSFGGWMWLNALATIAYGTVDRIVIGRVWGTAVAAEFNIYVQLTQLIHFIPASLFAFTYPEFSRLGVLKTENIHQIRRLYRRYVRNSLGIAGSLSILIILFMHPLLRLVGGRAFEVHPMPFVLLALSFLLISLNIIPYYFCLGQGTSRSVSLMTSISMLFSVITTATLIPVFGIEGAAIARLVYGTGALALIGYANRLLRQ